MLTAVGESILTEASLNYSAFTRFHNKAQIIDMGKAGRFQVYSIQRFSDNTKKGSKTPIPLAEYKKDPTKYLADQVVDDYDVVLFAKKISKILDKLSVPKMKGMMVWANYDAHKPAYNQYKPEASGWVYHADMGGSMAVLNMNRTASPIAKSKYAAFKGPRSPHSAVHEYCHQVWPHLSSGAKEAIAEFFNVHISPDYKAANKAHYLPNPDTNGKDNPTEWYCEAVGYSMYGTTRVNQEVIDFLKKVNKGQKVEVKKGATTPHAPKDPKSHSQAGLGAALAKMGLGGAVSIGKPKPSIELKGLKKLKKGGDIIGVLTQYNLIGKTLATGNISADPQYGPKHDGDIPWDKVWTRMGSHEKKSWRDAVRAVFQQMGGSPAGSRTGQGGSPSLWQYGPLIYYVNHPQGLARAKASVAVADLQESLVVTFPESRMQEFLSWAGRAAVNGKQAKLLEKKNGLVRVALPMESGMAVKQFFLGANVDYVLMNNTALMEG